MHLLSCLVQYIALKISLLDFQISKYFIISKDLCGLILGEITSGAYARPSLALMKSVRMPPPHLSSSQQLQPTSQPVVPVPIPPHHQQQPQTTNWSTSTMSFDPSQWQSLFPQGLRLSSGVPWCPPPQGTQSIYTPPFLFTPQNFDINQAHQSLYQPAYVLSPQGILVPAQAPYFVPVAQHPQFQPNIRSQVQSKLYKLTSCQ